MERNREARRGSMAAVNGGGLSRRRQRNGTLRDSPEEDGAAELPETSRLRDRTSKRDPERDRSSRSKRRRGDRLMHVGGGGREDGEGSSDESVDDEEDDEEDDQLVSNRTSAHPSTMMSPPTSSSAAQQNSHVRRNIPPARPMRPPPVWKVADEMIGVQIPRKARSASGKRSQESLVSSSSGGGGEQIHRQPPTSPARPSSTSTIHNSPSSSNASVKKKLKPISGGSLQQRPPKAASKPQTQDKIEIDVAEVLFKMARQFECNPPKQDNHKLEPKDDGSVINEVKSRASSPISQRSSNALSNQGTSAPKRKRPRVIKCDEDNAASLPSSNTQKMEPTEQTVKSEASSPKLDKLADSSKCSLDPLSSKAAVPAASSHTDAQNDSGVKSDNDRKPDLVGDQTESMEVPRPDQGVREDESDNKLKSEPPAEKPPAKLIIDLMETPQGKSSPDSGDHANDINKSSEPQMDLAQKIGDSGRDGQKMEPKWNQEEMLLGDGKKLEPTTDDFDVKKQKKKGLDLQLDLEKPSKEIVATTKDQNQKHQLPKAPAKSESKSEKPASPAVSFPLAVSGWPGNLNPFGYMGQVSSLPPVLPVDGSTGSSKSIIPPQRPNRCATHCYIAKSIHYCQQLTKMNAFWPAAAGTMQLYGSKPYNVNAVPPESAINNSLQGNLQGRSLSAMPDKGGSSVGNGYMAPAAGDKSSAASNSVAEAQRKQLMLQQIPQPGSANTMLHGPTFIFPLNQHTAGGAAAPTRPAAPKSAAMNLNASSATANIGATNTASGGSASAVNFNFTSLPPNEAQYLAILQNNGYPFHIPAHVSPYRGASPALAMPFFSGSFYSSQMIHPSQLQQQPVGQQANHAQQGHQNTSTSSGSSSSQKLQQKPKRAPGGGGPSATGGSSHSLPSSKQYHHTAEVNQDSLLANDTRGSHAQKNVYGHNFAMPIHPQNIAVISPAAGTPALAATGGNQNEKQQVPQTFAMSYASLAGATCAAAPAPPGLDFSTISQSHPLLHSLPEAARHSYQFSVAAAAAQTAHQKKSNHHEDGKSIGETMSASVGGEDERKAIAASKGPASGFQHSLTFSRPDGEGLSSIISTGIMDSSSRTLNLIQASNGGRVPNRSSNGVPTTSSSNTITNSPGMLQQQQQQQLIQLQKQQQQLQMQHQLTRPKSSERLPGGSSATKFPQTLSGFPQALIQGGGSPSQSPQWKSSSRLSATPLPSPTALSSSSKSQVPQLPRVSQANQPAPSHQTQISFGGNALKMAVGSIGGQSTLPSLSSTTSVVVGSLPNTVSKGANIGSPQGSSSVKSAPPATASLSSLPQSSDRNSPSNSSLKPSSVTNRNMPSILGPHIMSVPTSTSSSSTKQQQQQSPTQQKQQYPQPQLFFSSAYMPSQTSQANAIAYYQRQQAEMQSQQHNSNPTTMGVLSLCSAATHPVTDASKTTAAAGGLKGLPTHGLLQHPGQAASGTPYPLITAAAAAGFPYMSSMQSVTVKPPDQKPAAGTPYISSGRTRSNGIEGSHSLKCWPGCNTLNASWQPEKR